ncbi:hypothetical protein JRQ81_013749 [Phrynocephalus forsythii]|uniref:Uncharacterized protein n=1 Tax=Phrynocephalus forsythii TaxID=171643 RepID=A0A9Q1B4B9_9SAUR|nr:hypothetical protein JRQ81_013749 [Phrynocephalus forsythii]
MLEEAVASSFLNLATKPDASSASTFILPSRLLDLTMSHATSNALFTISSNNVIYAISPTRPSALYMGQKGQSLHKRINGHKSDIRNGNK